MDDDTRELWLSLGERLAVAGPDKFADVIRRLEAVAEAQEIIASYDHQLWLRGGRRPTKRYQA